MASWYATFTELAAAGIPLSKWLEFHRMRRAEMTEAQRMREGY